MTTLKNDNSDQSVSMNRQIMFRAIVDGKVNPVFAIKYRSDGVFVLVGDEVSSTTYSINDIEIQQYTGLKDKNGVDICEGDIVTNGSQKWIVKFNQIDCCYNLVAYGINRVEIVGAGSVHKKYDFLSEK